MTCMVTLSHPEDCSGNAQHHNRKPLESFGIDKADSSIQTVRMTQVLGNPADIIFYRTFPLVSCHSHLSP